MAGDEDVRQLSGSLMDFLTRRAAGRDAAPASQPVLHCAICDGFLLNPVTVACGHTFCRRCLATRQACVTCGNKLHPGGGAAVNVLVQRLVEKWWPRELKVARMRQEASDLEQRNNAEQAVDRYNQALVLAPQDVLVLCDRSHALSCLNRHQAALKDADNMVRLRPSWSKGHHRRGVALSNVGRYEEASFALCVSVALDRSTRQAVGPDLAQALQQLLQAPHSTQLQGLAACVWQHLDSLPTSSQWLQPPTVVDEADFDCVLCYRTLLCPVTTPCGHTYCRTCLDRCLDYRQACPLCMTSLSEYVRRGRKSVTHFVEGCLQALLPAQLNARLRELPALGDSYLPVFICTVGFPGVPCPLYVYEPRYRVMVRRCIEAGHRQFGIAASLGGGRYTDYGTLLEIRDCLLLGDGSSLLATEGVRRFRVVARSETDGYDMARVEFLSDQPIPSQQLARVSQLCERVRLKGVLWLSSVGTTEQAEIVRTLGRMPLPEKDWVSRADGPAWTWWLLPLLPLGQHLQVGILGSTSLEKRLRAIEKTLNLMQKLVPSHVGNPAPVSVATRGLVA